MGGDKFDPESPLGAAQCIESPHYEYRVACATRAINFNRNQIDKNTNSIDGLQNQIDNLNFDDPGIIEIINNQSELDREYTDTKAGQAEKNANGYTDMKIVDNNKVINKNIENAKHEAISVSNTYTDNKFNQLQIENDSRFNDADKKMNRNAKQANSGIASVSAMASIPYKTDLDTPFSFGMGLGNYRSGNAIAAGAQYQIKNNVNLRANISWNDSDSAVVGGGVAMSW